MIILGLDPGSTNLGYAIYDTITETILDNGEIVSKQLVFEDKLVNIHNIITSKLMQYKIDVVSFEQPVFMSRGNVGEKLNRALGVVLTLVRLQGANIFSYSPKTIKKDITGSGNADKNEVSDAVAKFFNIKNKFSSNHASDSLACIICYLKDQQLI